MSIATYSVCVDWDNNGDFVGAFDDITSDVLHNSLYWRRGKSLELDKCEPGTCEFMVKNADNKYNSENAGSDLAGNLLPRRPVRVQAVFDGNTYPLFYGYISEINPHPHPDEQYAYIRAIDGLDYLARAEISTSLELGIGTGAAVTKILDAASWPAGLRTIDTGQDAIPFAYWQSVKARFALDEVEESEVGLVYVDGSGKLVFEDRHHRMKHTTSGTFTNAMMNALYSITAEDVRNRATAKITPWTLGSTAVFWTLERTGADSPLVAAGESVTYWADADYFLNDITNPGATTDYTMNTASDGSGTSLTASFTVTPTKFAQTCKLVIANGADVPGYITFLQVRGDEYAPDETITLRADDATSQTAYQLRILNIDAKLMDDPAQGQDYANYLVSRWKDPQPRIQMSLANASDAQLVQILSREISDMITVTAARLSMTTEDFYINSMEHSVEQGGNIHRVTWTLSKVGEEGEFWILDTSTLGETTRLGY